MDKKKRSARKIAIIVTLICVVLVCCGMIGIVLNKVFNADDARDASEESSVDESSSIDGSSVDESVDGSVDEEVSESSAAEESSDVSDEDESNADSVLTRTNYYDFDGNLVYYEAYSYYDNGLLCSSTLFSVNYYENEVDYIGSEYTFLYLYDKKGNLVDRVLSSLDSSFLGENDGEIIIDYIYDEDGNSTEINIYPEEESVDQRRFGVDSSKTEKIYGDAYVFDTDSAEWAKVYLENAFDEGLVSEWTVCKLLHVNDDSVPELWVDYSYGYAPGKLFTQADGELDSVMLAYGYVEFIEKENLLLACGGHMDVYWDELYKIEDGRFVMLSSGEYGTIGESVEYDEEYIPIYTYEWDGVEVTEDEYFEHRMEAFDSSLAANSQMCVFNYEQCELLLKVIANGGVYDGSVE